MARKSKLQLRILEEGITQKALAAKLDVFDVPPPKRREVSP